MDYEHEPPIYRESYHLTIDVLRFTKDCHKDFRFTLGTALQNAILEMNLQLYLINTSEDDTEKALAKTIYKLYFVRMILRSFIDMSLMKMETSVSLNVRLEDLLDSLNNWKRSLQKKRQKSVSSV